jgi:hypothetical protein
MQRMEDRIMAKIVQEIRIELAARELLALDRVEGHLLTCRTGELWITLDGSQEDVILGPGQSWRVTNHHPVVVSALRASVLAAIHPHGRAPCIVPHGRAGWILAALLRWKHPPLARYPAVSLR